MLTIALIITAALTVPFITAFFIVCIFDERIPMVAKLEKILDRIILGGHSRY